MLFRMSIAKGIGRTIGSVAVAVMALVMVPEARCGNPEPVDSLRAVSADSVPSFMIPAGEPESAATEMTPLAGGRDATGIMDVGFVRRRYASLPRFSASLEQPYAWNGGAFYGSGGVMTMPGMMAVETGRLNLAHQMGPVRLTLWGEATKYGFFRGLQTQYGFGGSVDVRLSRRWSLTAYGSYYTGVAVPTPGMTGFLNTSRFGAYASYDFSNHWGVSVGAESNRSLVTNRWQTRPIVMPYYRVNKDVKIGIDVGGILYEVARLYIDSRDARRRGPGMIGPMRGGPPPVAPRR